MTNTDERSAVELDDLPAWDDPDTLDRLAQQLTATDACSLAIYGLDSDNQTLVGIGPVESARRSREATEEPDSQRMPQSEPPGPFIAGEEEELPALLRSRKLGGWAIAVPASLVAVAAALVLVRGRAPDSPPATKLERPAVAARPIVAPAPPAADPIEPPPAEARPAASLEPADEAAALRTSPVPAPSAQAAAQAPTRVAALPVKLPELSSPVLVDRSRDTDVNVGTLKVTSNPPASVVLDGRPLGKAPLVVRVPAGIHSLLFIHPLYGRRSLSVSVSPGATMGASAEF